MILLNGKTSPITERTEGYRGGIAYSAPKPGERMRKRERLTQRSFYFGLPLLLSNKGRFGQ